MTIVRPPARWGIVSIIGDRVKSFEEKNINNEGWINGGFMVIEPTIFEKYKYTSRTILEKNILANVAKKNQLNAFRHYGFWQCMDTLRDKMTLNNLNKKNAPWKI